MAFPGFDSPAYGTVGGMLPWGGAGGGGVYGAATNNPAAIAADYGAAYNNALSMNQSNYNNILSGYQQALATHTSAQQAISTGYSDLYNQVLGKIQGIGQARSDAINRDAAASLGKSSQQLIDRGLGNSTIQTNLNRASEADRNSRQLELSDQLAGQLGQYMSNLGLAGLAGQQRGLDNNTALLLRQLDFQNSVTAKYPDAGLYASLAGQAGANRGGVTGATYGGGAFGGGAAPRVGYVPGGGPYYPDEGGYGGGGFNTSVGYGGGYGGGGGGVGVAAAATPGGGGFIGDLSNYWQDAAAAGGGGGGGGFIGDLSNYWQNAAAVAPGYDKPAAAPIDTSAIADAAASYGSAFNW